jgi:hypothetical protein
MRTLIWLCAVILAGCASVSTPPAPATSASVPACDSSLWDHVYHPDRLHVIDACRTVTGTVEAIRKEEDGDLHVLLKPDPAYADLVNAANKAEQHGDLVLEPVCVGPVTQPDAEAACQGFQFRMPVIHDGEHVQVTGSYVLDKRHNWMEIHPVSSISQEG